MVTKFFRGILSVTNKSPWSNENVYLMATNIANFVSLAKATSPSSFAKYINDINQTITDLIEKTQGNVVDIQAGNILAVWGANVPSKAVCEVAYSISDNLNNLNIQYDMRNFQPAEIHIAVSFGECICESNQGRYIQVLGEPVNKVSNMLRFGEKGAGNIFIDEAIIY